MRRFLKIILIIAASITLLVLSVLIGAWFGGNYAENLKFNGVRGYEATAQIGLICGCLLLLGISYLHWVKRK